MVDTLHDYNGLASTAPRSVRKKFAKPPVKVACLPWWANPVEKKRGNFSTNINLVGLREHGVAARCHARMYVCFVLWMLWGAYLLWIWVDQCSLHGTNIYFSVLAKTENALIYPANEVGHAKRRRSPPCHQNKNRGRMMLCIILSLHPRSLKKVRHCPDARKKKATY